MSVQSQINRISGNISNAYSAVSSKGGTLPSSQTSANLSTAISSIPVGYPIEVATDVGMSAVLVDDNVGKVYKFTGTTGTYVNGDLYVVYSEPPAIGDVYFYDILENNYLYIDTSRFYLYSGATCSSTINFDCTITGRYTLQVEEGQTITLQDDYGNTQVFEVIYSEGDVNSYNNTFSLSITFSNVSGNFIMSIASDNIRTATNNGAATIYSNVSGLGRGMWHFESCELLVYAF